ncbi:MAG TPA: adenylate/guanylate cyclase domain-containing protein [Streptosporangiaceae bacterium]|nr:adenylate/guanylate cyclase domain-containing protein [Streptosporangiaceae bacterium]
MGCGRCGALVEDGDLFCGDCGAPVGGCPACGKPLTPGKRFCRYCGATLAAVAPAPAAAAPPTPPGRESAAERRVCSVLFCDVVGFTPLSESRDPEAVRELLSQYFAAARTVISRYGGVVEKFIGDAVMAVWGTPVATEGDAERAVRAALDLVAAVAELGAESGLPGLAARAGVVTGEVAVNLGAVGEGMVAGDAVNTASRVQAAAGPGSVLVDVPTQRLTGSAIAFADAGERTLKGKAEAQRLWRATRVLSAVGGVMRVDGLEAPLTGRDAELRTIKDLFHATADRRVPRLVLVSGPAGVGKSRLGWEFEKYADGLAADVWWHRGRCLSYGEGVAFWALAQIVRQRLGIAEEDPPEAAAVKLAAALDRFVPDPAEHAYAGLRLGRLLGVSFAADSGETLSREELFAGWRLFFERLAAEDPVILLVEDAQYADKGLLDFLDYLIDWVRDLPVYVLVFARPELGQARPGFGAGRNRSTLTLDPLDAASMDLLVDALVPDMPEPARSKITRQAQGIPLFAVETVRSLIDRDVVQPVEGVYRLTGDVGELAVPDSLHALLAARLDALDPGARRLVADAAVLGTTFPAEALIGVSERDEPSVRDALADLVRREVLSVSADPLSPERGSYRFSQEMLRQVAYDTLSRRDRKARHLAVAAHLRQAFPSDGEEVTDVIARHYLDALNAMPDDPDATEIRGQAVTALTRAAERAERTGAPAGAAASYAAAAGLIPSGPADGPAASLWERAAQAAFADASYPMAIEYVERARGHYLQRGQARAAARVQALAGQALKFRGRHAEAREQLIAAVEVLREGPDADTVRAVNQLAGLEVFDGSPDADRLSGESLALGQALNVGPGQLSELLLTRGLYHLMAGRRPQAISYLRESVRLATQAGDNFTMGHALLNLSDALASSDPAAAADAARTAAGYLRRTGERHYLAVAIINVAEALIQIGDWDAAEAEYTQAVESDALADIEDLSYEHGWLAALRGDHQTAGEILTALRDIRANEDPEVRAGISVLEAFAAAARRQPADALRHARAILALAGTVGISNVYLRWAWPLAVRCAHELADTAAARDLLAMLDSYQPGHLAPMLRAERELISARLAAVNGADGAAAAFTAAIATLREMSTPYHLAHGLLDHAEYLRAGGDAPAAEAAIDEARDLAGRLRCRPLLSRADALSPTLTSRDTPRVAR